MSYLWMLVWGPHLILFVISKHYYPVPELCLSTYAGISVISHSWFREELLRPWQWMQWKEVKSPLFTWLYASLFCSCADRRGHSSESLAAISVSLYLRQIVSYTFTEVDEHHTEGSVSERPPSWELLPVLVTWALNFFLFKTLSLNMNIYHSSA